MPNVGDVSGNAKWNGTSWDRVDAGGGGAAAPGGGATSGGFGYDPSTFNRQVQATTPGSGMGAQDINNTRFDQWADQGSTQDFQKYLQGQGYNSDITKTNFSGGPTPMGPDGKPVDQLNLNMNGNLFNSALLQSQYESNGRNPDGSFNTDFANKWLQDQLNSNGFGGAQQTPFADGQVYGMGGQNKLTDNGISYDYGMGAGASYRPTQYQAASQALGNPQANGSPLTMNQMSSMGQPITQSGSPGQGGGGQGQNTGGWPTASQSMQPQGGGMAQAGMNGGMAGAAWPRYAMGGMGGGMYPSRGAGFAGMRRPPALGAGMGGFGGGMQNSQYYPQSEPMMRQGMQNNFQQAGQAPMYSQQVQPEGWGGGQQGGGWGGLGQLLSGLFGGGGGGGSYTGMIGNMGNPDNRKY